MSKSIFSEERFTAAQTNGLIENSILWVDETQNDDQMKIQPTAE